jgi:hypothetical protein
MEQGSVNPDTYLQPTVEHQGMTEPFPIFPGQEASQGQSQEKHPKDCGDGRGRTAEDQDGKASPDDLVDQAAGPG